MEQPVDGAEDGAARRTEPRGADLRHRLAALAIVAVCVAWTLGAALRPGMTTVAGNLLASIAPYSSVVAGPGAEQKTGQSDVVFHFYPYFVELTRAVSRGELPLWSPAAFSGTPFLVSVSWAHPFFWSSLVVPGPRFYVILVFLQALLAAWFTYLLLEAWGADRPGALTAAVAFALSGALVVWRGHHVATVLAHLPWVLYSTLRLLVDPRGATFAGLVVSCALVLLAGHLGTAAHVLWIGAIYVLWHLLVELGGTWTARTTAVGTWGLAMALAFGISSVQWVPFLEYHANSARRHHDGLVTDQVPVTGQPGRFLRSVSVFLFPDLMGSGARGLDGVAALSTGRSVNTELAAWVATPTVLLAIVAVLRRPRSTVGPFLAALAVLSFGVGKEAPLLATLGVLVPYRPDRFACFAAFCAACLAGLGVTRLGEAPGWRSRWATAAWSLLAAAALAALACAWLLGGPARERIATLLDPFVVSSFQKASADEARNSPLDWRRDRVRRYLSEGSRAVRVPLLLVLVTTALLAGLSSGRVAVAAARPVLIGLVVVGHIHWASGWDPAVPVRWVFPETPAIEYLKSRPGPFRIVGHAGTCMPNAAMVHGLEDVRGYDALEIHRYHRLLDLAGKAWAPWRFEASLLQIGASPVLDLLNVRYYLYPERRRDPGLRLVFGREVWIYERESARDRVFVVPRVRFVATADRAFELLADSRFDPLGTLIVEGDPDPARAAGARGEVRSIEVERHRLRAVVTMDRPGYVVVSIPFYPGFGATVDGAAVPIRAAYGALQAVPVPAGRSELVVRYEPLSFKIGVGVSVLSLVALCAIWLIWRADRPGRGARGRGRAEDRPQVTTGRTGRRDALE
ncbi:MAG: YfhO family protein [Candidatus Riflebacteria bacterium]|nr:YfhO family protein [Candidatus Riflebacteria bacterium]